MAHEGGVGVEELGGDDLCEYGEGDTWDGYAEDCAGGGAVGARARQDCAEAEEDAAEADCAGGAEGRVEEGQERVETRRG